MKLLISLIVPIFCFELGMLVSSQSLTDAFTELIKVDAVGLTSSTNSLVEQYFNMSAELDKELYNNILPSLNQTNDDINDYITKLDNQLTSLGYNFKNCILLVESKFKTVSSIASLTNVTAKAIAEKENVYEAILSNIYSVGLENIYTVHREIKSLHDEYLTCVNSDYVQYCNTTVYDKLVAKQEEFPKLYKKETEIVKMNLIQQGLVYKTRVEDYVNEVIKTAKPYLALLEICAQRMFSL